MADAVTPVQALLARRRHGVERDARLSDESNVIEPALHNVSNTVSVAQLAIKL